VIKDAIISLFRENMELKVAMAIELYKKGEVSLSRAGEFWDSHSSADYWNEMEEKEIEFDIRKRTLT